MQWLLGFMFLQQQCLSIFCDTAVIWITELENHTVEFLLDWVPKLQVRYLHQQTLFPVNISPHAETLLPVDTSLHAEIYL